MSKKTGRSYANQASSDKNKQISTHLAHNRTLDAPSLSLNEGLQRKVKFLFFYLFCSATSRRRLVTIRLKQTSCNPLPSCVPRGTRVSPVAKSSRSRRAYIDVCKRVQCF